MSTVIYNPIDCDYIHKFARSKKERQGITLLYYGTIAPKKGVMDIPLIFNKVSKQSNKVNLMLIGKDAVVDGYSTWEACRSLFSSEALKRTKYLGPLSYEELMPYVDDADICLFPSHAETFGLVLLEAMFMQKAIVCSDIDCFKEIVNDKVEAICCPVKDVDSFSSAVSRLINDKEERKRLAENAYRRAHEKFNPSVIVKQNVSFYKEVLATTLK